jgi:hypothetical protein
MHEQHIFSSYKQQRGSRRRRRSTSYSARNATYGNMQALYYILGYRRYLVKRKEKMQKINRMKERIQERWEPEKITDREGRIHMEWDHMK